MVSVKNVIRWTDNVEVHVKKEMFAAMGRVQSIVIVIRRIRNVTYV